MSMPWRLINHEGRIAMGTSASGTTFIMAFHTKEGAISVTKLDARYAGLKPVNIASLAWRLKSIARKHAHRLCRVMPHKWRTVIFNDEFTNYEYVKGRMCDRCGASEHFDKRGNFMLS